MDISTAAASAKSASLRLAAVGTAEKNRALEAIADALEDNGSDIVAANEQDLENGRESGLAAPLMKRLKFDRKKLFAALDGIRSLVELPDPVGQVISSRELDHGLDLYKVSCPIGLIGVIFESRPDALVQISTLCLKSGNAVLLKGGSEAVHTNRILASTIAQASEASGIPPGWLQLAETRADVERMLKMDDHIDLLVPRGSNEFVRHIMENSSIPVLGHADGVCHVYVDAQADAGMAVDIVVDGKCQYVAVCNALETLLVHAGVAETFLPAAKDALEERGVQLRGCERTRAIIDAEPATDADWKTEYLDLILSIKVVESLDEAVEHINTHGSGHTDAIVTADAGAAEKFMDGVDSGNVFWNCSTRFSDGYRYGLGAEVGISTAKIHARGPVGLEGLVIYKWKLKGTGQIVAPYADGTRSFTHRPLNGR